ncbi:hypothetical protein HDU76_010540 [Blyttiomyces sp. JEL0837]|nr:hypothetical protein HDU76_010540 [Blyttiomyces sp. JEL0837]
MDTKHAGNQQQEQQQQLQQQQIPLIKTKLESSGIDLLDPLLGRMTMDTLRMVFENELNHCIRCMRHFSKVDQSSELAATNSQRRLAVGQFKDCWEKFSLKMTSDYILAKLVETGEVVLGIRGFHDVAETMCFAPYLEKASGLAVDTNIKSQEDLTGNNDMEPHSPRESKEQPALASTDQTPVSRIVTKISATSHKALKIRSLYGRALCQFLRLVDMDVTLRTPRIRVSVKTILSNIMDVIDECSRSESTEWLLLNGSFHIRSITDKLLNSGFMWPEALDALKQVVRYFEQSTTLLEPQNVPWLMDIYGVIHHHLLQAGNVEDIRSFIANCSATIDTIAEGYSARISMTPSMSQSGEATTRTHPLVEQAMHKLNVWLFGCEIREVASGRRVKTDRQSLADLVHANEQARKLGYSRDVTSNEGNGTMSAMIRVQPPSAQSKSGSTSMLRYQALRRLNTGGVDHNQVTLSELMELATSRLGAIIEAPDKLEDDGSGDKRGRPSLVRRSIQAQPPPRGSGSATNSVENNEPEEDISAKPVLIPIMQRRRSSVFRYHPDLNEGHQDSSLAPGKRGSIDESKQALPQIKGGRRPSGASQLLRRMSNTGRKGLKILPGIQAKPKVPLLEEAEVDENMGDMSTHMDAEVSKEEYDGQTEHYGKDAFVRSLAPSLADSSVKQSKKTQQFTRGQQQQPTKKAKVAVVLQESEDHKARRLMITDVVNMLHYFLSDADKLHALVHAIACLLPTPSKPSNDITLQYTEKVKDKDTKDKDTKVLNLLLDIAFELFLSAPESILAKGSLLATMSSEVEPGKPPPNVYQPFGNIPDLAAVNKLIKDGCIGRFSETDLIRLARSLFEHHQWERFSVMAQVMESYIFGKEKVLDCAPAAVNQSSLAIARELSLRVATINFLNVTHAERKVLFDAETSLTQTFADIRNRRFKVSEAVHQSAIELLQSISECIELPIICEKAPRLLVDCAHIMWKIVEPLFRDINALKDVDDFDSLGPQDTVMLMFRSVHVIFSEFYNEDILPGILITKKLSIVLEGLGYVDDAITVLKESIERIQQCRREYGEGADGVESVTCNVRFHPGFNIPEVYSQLPSVDEAIRTLRMELPCYEMELTAALIRCDLKKTYKTAVLQKAKNEEEHFRLTRKRQPPSVIAAHPTKLKIAEFCRENAGSRALLLAIYAIDGPNLTFDERHQYLCQAVSALKSHHKSERKMLDVIAGNISPTCLETMRCPAPSLIRRTLTSITIRANHMTYESGIIFIPYFYQAFGKKAGRGKVALNDVELRGCGEYVRVENGEAEITVFGLSPNEKYVFAVAAYDEAGQLMGSGISETTPTIIPTYPTPLVLCWGYLADISHEIRCDDIANESFKTLWNYFVEKAATDDILFKLPSPGYTGVDHTPVFIINETNLNAASAETVRLFIKSIHALISRQFSGKALTIYTDPAGKREVLSSQLIRLRSARDLFVALALGEKMQLHQLALLSAVQIARILFPFFDCKVETPFMIHGLLTAHACLLSHSTVLESLDMPDIMWDIFCPTTLYLVNTLLQWKEFSHAFRIAESSLAFIHSVAGTVDTRIMNSGFLEQSWTGIAPRVKRVRYGASTRRNIAAGIHSENVHHTLIAVGKNPLLGYTSERRRIEIFCEKLECIAIQCTFVLRQPLVSDRRVLDTHTSLREMYAVLLAAGPEVVLTELIRFKKNPRFLEMIVHCAWWCLNKGLFDQAYKICQDTFEWLNMRNRYILGSAAVTDESGLIREIFTKRRRKNLFVERKPANEWDHERLRERRSRSRTRERDRDEWDRVEKLKNSLVDGGGPPRRRQIIKSHDDGDGTAKERDRSQTPPDRDRSESPRGRSRDKERPRSNERAPSRDGSSSSRDHSQSPDVERELKNGGSKTDTAKRIGRKRKKMAQRNILLAGLSPQDRENLERSIRCLDSTLAYIWRRIRHGRRLRCILDYEASWRSQLAYLFARTMLARFEKDNMTRYSGTVHHQSTPLRFILKNGFGILAPPPAIIDSVEYERIFPKYNCDDNSISKTTPESQRTVSDIIQSFVQSICLANRAGKWHQLMIGCRTFFNSLHYFSSNGFFASEFWARSLWRAFYITGDCLMDMLSTIEITVSCTHDSDPNSSDQQSTLHKKQFNLKTQCIFSQARELINSRLEYSWHNESGETEVDNLDLPWCAQFLISAAEIIRDASKLHRAILFATRCNQLFQGMYENVLEPIIRGARNDIQRAQEIKKPHGILKMPQASLETKYPKSQLECLIDGTISTEQMLPHELLHMCRMSGKEYATTVLARKPSSKIFIKTMSFYEALIGKAARDTDTDLLCEICNEYGDLLHLNEDVKGAAVFWSRCIDAALGVQRSLTQWRKILGSHGPHACVGNAKRTILAGVAAAKLARHMYWNDMDRNQELLFLSTRLLASLLHSSIPHPKDPLAYASYLPGSLLPHLELFTDCNSLNPFSLCEVLTETARDMVAYDKIMEALPLTAFCAYIAAEIAENELAFGSMLLLQGDILLRLGFVRQSIDRLVLIANGGGLLPKNKRYYTSTSPPFENTYDDSEAVFSTKNWKMIESIVNMTLTDKLVNIYKEKFRNIYDFCRLQTVVNLLKLCRANDPRAANPAFINLVQKMSGIMHLDSNMQFEDQLIPSKQYFHTWQDDLTSHAILKTFNSLVQGASIYQTVVPRPVSDKTQPGTTLHEWKDINSVLNVISIALDAMWIAGKQVFHGSDIAFWQLEYVRRMIKLTELSATVSYLQFRYDDAIRRLIQMQDYLGKWSDDIGQSVCSVYQWQNLRLTTTTMLLAIGCFEPARDLAMVGIRDSQTAKSRPFELRFRSLFLYAQMWIKPMQNDEEWEQKLSKLNNLINLERKGFTNNLVLAQAWETYGDVLFHTEPEKHEAIILAYDQAEECLQKYMDPKNGYRIPFTTHSSVYELRNIIRSKRARINLTVLNHGAALELVNEVIHTGKYMPNLIPRHSILAATLLFADAMSRNRINLQFGSDGYLNLMAQAKKAYLGVIECEMSNGGSDLTILKSAFSGMLALAIESHPYYSHIPLFIKMVHTALETELGNQYTDQFCFTAKCHEPFMSVPCIQWINLPVRAVNYCSSFNETAEDRAWVMVISFASGESSSPRSPDGRKSVSERKSVTGRRSVINSRREKSPADSHDLGRTQMANTYVSQIPQSTVARIGDITRKALLNLKKYNITLDTEYLKESREDYFSSLEIIALYLTGSVDKLQATNPPEISVAALESLRKGFKLDQGFIPENSSDEAIFAWLRRLVLELN